MLGLFYQLAPAATTTTGGETTQGGFMSFLPIILMVVFMYLLVFMPENKRRKKLKKQLEALKQGDKVVTLGQIIGTVEFISEKVVYIKTLDTKIEVAKTGIASILDEGKIN